MRVVAIAPKYDTPGINKRTGKPWRDASSVFIPEAKRWVSLHGGDVRRDVIQFDNTLSKPKRHEQVMAALAAIQGPVDCVAVFAHGLKDGLQFGANLSNVSTTAAALARLEPFVVLLMTCDAGRDLDTDRSDDLQPGPGGDGGYADTLRDSFASLGKAVTVYAHAVDGHATRNPFVRVFRAGESAGGSFLVEPPAKGKKPSKEWLTWKRRLRDPNDTLRLQYWSLEPSSFASGG